MVLRLPSLAPSVPQPSSLVLKRVYVRCLTPYLLRSRPALHGGIRKTMASSAFPSTEPASTPASAVTPASERFRLLFVEMGTGYDQHGDPRPAPDFQKLGTSVSDLNWQDITVAAMRACKNAISSNSIPAFRTGALPGVSWQQMKLKVKLGVPSSLQSSLDLDKVKAVFPYGEILETDVVDGGLICSSGVALEAMGDKNDDCYIVNAAIYVGY